MTDPDTLREITAAAAAAYTEPLRRRAAVSYLHQRGIDATALAPVWVLGYAPPGWTRLVDQLRGRFADQALLNAGLARLSSRETLIDTFRDRVVFGLRNPDGTIAGFIGRDLSGSPNAPKYLNTRQHPLFDKGRLLFGLYEGTRDAAQLQPVVVEGPLDVLAIAAHRTGAEDPGLLPVAACGTAFTVDQARSIANATSCDNPSAVVAMDGDPAGGAAALNVGERLRDVGLDVRLTMLPNGMDPADYLTRPGSRLTTFHADHGLPLIHLHVEHAIAKQGDNMQWIEGRLAALRNVAGYLATYAPDYTARQIGWLTEVFSLDGSTVSSELVQAYNRSTRLEIPLGAHSALAAPGAVTI